MKYRAAILGCGRMGVGGPGWVFPYTYTHADTYMALKDRVELIAVADLDEEKREAAAQRFGVPCYKDVGELLANRSPDIVSICTPNGTHTQVINAVQDGSVKAIWLEKPSELAMPLSIPVQVNYCRRFCRVHRAVQDMVMGRRTNLHVWAKKDWTTVVHFADLARMMGIPFEGIQYTDNIGEYPATNSYRIDAGKWAFDFRNGGCSNGFMETALTELLDALDGKRTTLSSSVASAIESERLAERIMGCRPPL